MQPGYVEIVNSVTCMRCSKCEWHINWTCSLHNTFTQQASNLQLGVKTEGIDV